MKSLIASCNTLVIFQLEELLIVKSSLLKLTVCNIAKYLKVKPCNFRLRPEK